MYMKKTRRARGNKFDLLRSIEKIKKKFTSKTIEEDTKLVEQLDKLIFFIESNRHLSNVDLNNIKSLLTYLLDEISANIEDWTLETRDNKGNKTKIYKYLYRLVETLLHEYLSYPKKETLEFTINLKDRVSKLKPTIKKKEVIERELIEFFEEILSTVTTHPISLRDGNEPTWWSDLLLGITKGRWENKILNFVIPHEIFDHPENNFEKFIHFLKANISVKYLYDSIINTEDPADYTYHLLESIEGMFTPDTIDLLRNIPNRSLKDIKLQEVIFNLIDNSPYDSGNSIRSIELTSLLLTKLDLRDDLLIEYLTKLSYILAFPTKGLTSSIFGRLENLPSYYKSRIWDLTGLEEIMKSINVDVLRLFDTSKLGSYLSEDVRIELESKVTREDLRVVRWINLIDNEKNRRIGNISKSTYLRLMNEFKSTVNDPKFKVKIKEMKYNKSKGMKGLAELKLSVNKGGKSVIKILKVVDELYPQIVEEMIEILLDKLQFKVNGSSIGIIHLT